MGVPKVFGKQDGVVGLTEEDVLRKKDGALPEKDLEDVVGNEDGVPEEDVVGRWRDESW